MTMQSPSAVNDGRKAQRHENVARSTGRRRQPSWPLPVHAQNYKAISEPMARGEWPSFCAEAIRLAALDDKGANGRNGRIARKMWVATTTVRRAVGSFAAIIAFADGERAIARKLSEIPFASAVILANWAKRDRDAALEALEECVQGMGTATLSAREVEARGGRAQPRWRPLGAKALAAEEQAHPEAPKWVLRARAMLRDLCDCKAGERGAVIAAHTKSRSEGAVPARLRGAALQRLAEMAAGRRDVLAAIGLTPAEASAPRISVDPSDAARVEAIAKRAHRRLAGAPAPAEEAGEKDLAEVKIKRSTRREAFAAWPLKGTMPRGAKDWLTAGHWHLIAQDAFKSELPPTKFARSKGMLAGTLGIAMRTLVDASDLAGGDPLKADALSRLSTAAVKSLRALNGTDPAKASAIIANVARFNHSSVLVKALAADKGVTAQDVATLPSRELAEQVRG